VPQVAEDLHVGVGTIEALEAGRLESLGAPVYAKGHLRKYARLLGLDAEALLGAYQTTQPPTPELVPLKPATRQRRFRISRTAYAIVVVAIVAAAAGWFLAQQGALRKAPEVAAKPAVTEHAPEAPSAPAPSEAAPAIVASELGPPTSTPPASAPLPPATSEPRRIEKAGAEENTGRVRVRMRFAADSWVEIYDASEQRVFFDMGARGTSRVVAAAPPLRVFLGFADGVQLELDGRPVTLPVQARRGNLAEFFLDAHGDVRPVR
jgi:cytoskeleton protein RodZ